MRIEKLEVPEVSAGTKQAFSEDLAASMRDKIAKQAQDAEWRMRLEAAALAKKAAPPAGGLGVAAGGVAKKGARRSSR